MDFLHNIDWSILMFQGSPLALLTVLGFVVLGFELWSGRNASVLALLGVACVAVLMGARWDAAADIQPMALLLFDRTSWFAMAVVLAVLAAVIVLSKQYIAVRELPRSEYLALLIFSAVGIWFMIATHHVLVLFIGLETFSLGAYVLAAYQRESKLSIEAGLKYFLLGAFASAFLVFGMAFLYGGTGSLDLIAIADQQAAYGGASHYIYTSIGVACLLVGFGFKVAAVPFHFWTPDVYGGAPLPVTSFFATAVKLGAFVALWRILDAVMHFNTHDLRAVLWALAVSTILLANLAALKQANVKRMLAYSSVAHAGYAMLAFLVIPHIPADAQSSLLLYLTAYSVTTIAAFAVLIILTGTNRDEITSIDDFAGLAKFNPAVAFAFACAMFSLAGLPPTLGFFGKYYLFSAAVHVGEFSAVIFAVLGSVISVAYYVRPVVYMYFRSAPENAQPLVVARGVGIVLLLATLAIILGGIFPSCLLDLARAVS